MEASQRTKILQRSSALIILIIVVLINAAWLVLAKKQMYFFDRAKRISFLVDEMTTTPERQQRAFDELGKDEDGAFIYLLKHLGDQRTLANNNVMFLNTHPNSFERYFQTGSARVGEAVLRYLCWKTMKCDVDFDSANPQAIKAQREKLEKYCRDEFIDPGHYTN